MERGGREGEGGERGREKGDKELKGEMCLIVP